MRADEIAEILHAAIDGDNLVGAGMGHDNAGRDVALREATVKEVVWWAARAIGGCGCAERLRAESERRRGTNRPQLPLTYSADFLDAAPDARGSDLRAQEAATVSEQGDAKKRAEWNDPIECPGCGNRYDGDNFCMPSACELEE